MAGFKRQNDVSFGRVAAGEWVRRVGKFIRPCRSITPACNVSASSTSSPTPAGVRAVRPATITGFSASTRSRAASATAPASPWGGVGVLSAGMRMSAGTVPICQCSSIASATGPIGGVIAIL